MLITEIVAKLSDAISALRMPATIEIRHGEKSNLAGELNQVWALGRQANGSMGYVQIWSDDSDEQQDTFEEKQAALEVNHFFFDLADMNKAALDIFFPAVAFVNCKQFGNAQVVMCRIDKPELGNITMEVLRHPRAIAWLKRFGNQGFVMDMSHDDFADLVLDNREDLEDENFATLVAQFSSVKTVEYDADLGSSGHVGVRVQWKGKNGAKGDVIFPRSFTAIIPAHSGLWKSGEEPRIKAEFRVRVLPPKKDDEAPKFRVTWINPYEYEIDAANHVIDHCKQHLSILCYAGIPSAKSYVIPGREE